MRQLGILNRTVYVHESNFYFSQNFSLRVIHTTSGFCYKFVQHNYNIIQVFLFLLLFYYKTLKTLIHKKLC